MSLPKRLLKLAGSNADLTRAERKTCKEAAAVVIAATAQKVAAICELDGCCMLRDIPPAAKEKS